MTLRSNSPLLNFEEVLMAIVAVVGFSQTLSKPAWVHLRFLDRPATPTTPALLRVRIAVADKCTASGSGVVTRVLNYSVDVLK